MNEFSERLLVALKQDLGTVVMRALEDPKVEDVALNDDLTLHVKRLAEPWQKIGEMERTDALGVISAVARFYDLNVNTQQPYLEAILPFGGSRFEGVLPPAVRAPVFSIRTRSKLVRSLDDYLQQGIITPTQADHLRRAIRNRKTVLVSGSPGSGKTTLLGALLRFLAELDPEPRVGIVEDTPELNYSGRNSVSMVAPVGHNSMLRSLQAALRMRFDRIVVGEVRDQACLTMLKAFNVGTPGGLATIHANDAKAALLRLESLVQEAVPGYDARSLIAEAIQVIVHMDGPRDEQPRRVREVLAIAGPDDGAGFYALEPLT